MKIVFVVHDFSLTGAPKLGVQMATLFARHHQVVLVTKKDGPLRDMINTEVFEDVIVSGTNAEICTDGLKDRVAAAARLLRKLKPDLVYVNSAAAGDWISAAQRVRCRSVLHIHEMLHELMQLHRVYDAYDMKRTDLVVVASTECSRDVQKLFRFPQNKITNFGVCVDVEDIHRRMYDPQPLAVRHDSEMLAYADSKGRRIRKVITMCGVAAHRKGADLFWHTAQRVPEHDFLWIGPWDEAPAALVNGALALNRETPLDNLYWTNMAANPYAAMARADLMVLTAREDPNPLVVPEAIAIGLPVVAFVGSGGSHYWTSRYGLSLTGEVDPARLAAFICRFFSSGQRSWQPDGSFYELADLKRRTIGLMEELERLAA